MEQVWMMLKLQRDKVKNLKINLRWKWIKGHQDDVAHLKGLDEWAQLNVRADEPARNHLDKTQPLKNIRFPNNGWEIGYKNEKLAFVDKNEL